MSTHGPFSTAELHDATHDSDINLSYAMGATDDMEAGFKGPPLAEVYIETCSQFQATPVDAFLNVLHTHSHECTLGPHDIPLEQDLMIILTNLIENPHLEELDLSGVQISVNSANIIHKVLSTNEALRTLKLGDTRLDGQAIATICHAMPENGTLLAMDLRSNPIDPAGGMALSQMLGGNNTLVSLNLQKCGMGPETCASLAKALWTNPSLTSLNLRFNQVGDEGACALADTLSRSNVLKVLDFGGNEIGSRGGEGLAKALITNRSLRTLNLRSNAIGPEACERFGEALSVNACLEELFFGYNPATEKGATKVISALTQSTGLRSLDLHGIPLAKEGLQAMGKALLFNVPLLQLIVQASEGESPRPLLDGLKGNAHIQYLTLDGVSLDEVDAEMMMATLTANKLLAMFNDSNGHAKLGELSAQEVHVLRGALAHTHQPAHPNPIPSPIKGSHPMDPQPMEMLLQKVAQIELEAQARNRELAATTERLKFLELRAKDEEARPQSAKAANEEEVPKAEMVEIETHLLQRIDANQKDTDKLVMWSQQRIGDIHSNHNSLAADVESLWRSVKSGETEALQFKSEMRQSLSEMTDRFDTIATQQMELERQLREREVDRDEAWQTLKRCLEDQVEAITTRADKHIEEAAMAVAHNLEEIKATNLALTAQHLNLKQQVQDAVRQVEECKLKQEEAIHELHQSKMQPNAKTASPPDSDHDPTIADARTEIRTLLSSVFERLDSFDQRLEGFSNDLAHSKEGSSFAAAQFHLTQQLADTIASEHQALHIQVQEVTSSNATKTSALEQQMDGLRDHLKEASVRLGDFAIQIAQQVSTQQTQTTKLIDTHKLEINARIQDVTEAYANQTMNQSVLPEDARQTLEAMSAMVGEVQSNQNLQQRLDETVQYFQTYQDRVDMVLQEVVNNINTKVEELSGTRDPSSIPPPVVAEIVNRVETLEEAFRQDQKASMVALEAILKEQSMIHNNSTVNSSVMDPNTTLSNATYAIQVSVGNQPNSRSASMDLSTHSPWHSAISIDGSMVGPNPKVFDLYPSQHMPTRASTSPHPTSPSKQPRHPPANSQISKAHTPSQGTGSTAPRLASATTSRNEGSHFHSLSLSSPQPSAVAYPTAPDPLPRQQRPPSPLACLTNTLPTTNTGRVSPPSDPSRVAPPSKLGLQPQLRTSGHPSLPTTTPVHNWVPLGPKLTLPTAGPPSRAPARASATHSMTQH